MGRRLILLRRTSSRFAESKANVRTYSTTLPPSLEAPSGVFDAPVDKCRDFERGHGGPVRGGNHAYHPFNSVSTAKSVDIPMPVANRRAAAPLTPDPSPTLGKATSVRPLSPFISSLGAKFAEPPTPPSTPPLMACTGRPLASSGGILDDVFPLHGARLRPYVDNVSLECFQPDGTTVQWDGFTINVPPERIISPRPTSGHAGAPHDGRSSPRSAFKGSRAATLGPSRSLPAAKSLYVSARGPLVQGDRLREIVVALLDLASEHLGCESVILVLDRGVQGAQADRHFRDLLHSLMYAGGTVVSQPSYPVDPRFVLVGIEV